MCAEGKSNNKDNSPGKLFIWGKNNTAKHTLEDLSQCIATVITFENIQTECHPGLHTFPMLRVTPEGVVLLIYNNEFYILVVGNSIDWDGYEAFLLIWSAIHYCLFPLADLSQWKKYKCGFQAELKNNVKLTQAWYFESPSVYQRKRKVPKYFRRVDVGSQHKNPNLV